MVRNWHFPRWGWVPSWVAAKNERKKKRDFPGSTVAKGPHADAWGMGSISGLGGSQATKEQKPLSRNSRRPCPGEPAAAGPGGLKPAPHSEKAAHGSSRLALPHCS